MHGNHHHQWRHAMRRGFGAAREEMRRARREHRRGGRLFEQGDLRWAALALIAEAPRHGYDIIKEIEERSGGAYAPSPGVVYPTLTLLEDMGYATVSADGGRKLYAITADGTKVLEAHKAEVDSLFALMAETKARQSRPAPELHRAWENLRAALNLRVARAPMSAEQVLAVTAALDEAAKTIERS